MAGLLDRGFQRTMIAGTGKEPVLAAAALPPLPLPKPNSGPIDLAVAQAPAVGAEPDEGDAADDNPADLTDNEGWGIQVGAFTRREPAEQAAAAVISTIPELAGAQPQVIEVITGSATIYRARLTGLAERNAHEACRQLRARQAACLTVRPGGTVEVSAQN